MGVYLVFLEISDKLFLSDKIETRKYCYQCNNPLSVYSKISGVTCILIAKRKSSNTKRHGVRVYCIECVRRQEMYGVKESHINKFLKMVKPQVINA